MRNPFDLLRHPIILMVFLVALMLLLSLATYWMAFAVTKNDAPYAFLLISVALISFFGLIALSNTGDKPFKFTEASLRIAIAGSVVIEYLVLVAIVAFFREGDDLPPITQMLLGNFTAVVGVVIAFYFGSSALVQAKAKKESERE